jgi:hypothetical protein
VWTLRFDLKSPTRLGRLNPRQARATRPATLVPACAALLGVYAAYVAPVSIDPSINGRSTADPAIEVTGSGPRSGTSVLILRNGYAWPAALVSGRFASLVPLLPGLNRIQAAVNGRISVAVEVEGPKVAAARVSRAMVGECSGVIAVHPASGYEGDSDLVIVNIDRSAELITRVSTDNPLCHECDAARTAPNQFAVSERFRGQGPFRVTFMAFDKDGRVRCQGESADLTALGPR